jgi:hypothetical protein
MRREYQTDPGAWAVAAGAIAAAMVFAPLLPSGNGEPSVWDQVARLAGGRGLDSVATLVWDLLLVAATASVGGWLLQAVGVVCRLRLSGGQDHQLADDYGEAKAAGRSAVRHRPAGDAEIVTLMKGGKP